MRTFREIFRFEVSYHLHSALFWLAGILFFFLSFGAVSSDVVQIGGAIGNVNRNAPFVIVQILGVLSILGVFVTTAFVASAVVRDYEMGTDGIFFTTPVGKLPYVFGRFGGAFAVSVLIYLAVVLAIALGSVMPWLEPERVGPFMPGAYGWALLWLIVPNIFLMSAVFFSVATLTRTLWGTYVGLVAFFVGYLVAGTMLGDLESETLASMLDPFGFAAFQIATQYWTTVERNTRLLTVEGAFLWNRVLWVGVALMVLLLAAWRFSFTSSRARKRKGAGREAAAVEEAEDLGSQQVRPMGVLTGPSPALQYSVSAAWRQLAHAARFEVGTVLRSKAFLILLLLGVLNLIGNVSVVDQLFGTPVYPRTYLLIQAIQGGFLLFVVLVLTFYSGELVFRERQEGVAEVQDALPVPNWVFWGSKMAALTVVLAAVLTVGVLTAMGVQLYYGYTHFELGVYAEGIGGLVGWPFLLIAVLALFFQVATNQKYVGFLLVLLYFLSQPVLGALDFNHNLYLYGGSPGAPYSDLNGFGHFWTGALWFRIYWSFFALLLLVTVHLFWVRGKDTALRTRFALARLRFTRPVRAVAGIALVGFLGSGAWIFYNTNILNEYVPPDVGQERQTRYEKDYGRYDGIPQPKITSVYAEVDIFPYERAVDIRGSYRVRNKEAVPVDSLHMVWDRGTIDTLEVDVPGGEVVHQDSILGYRIYRLTPPLAPGEEMELGYTVTVRNAGFQNTAGGTDIIFNGTFFNNAGYFPHIGYNDAFEMSDPVERRRHDLPPIERFPSVYDTAAYDENYLTPESDWVDFETIVSTSADQIALAPGYIQEEWEEDGRRYFHYKMDAPILGFWSYLSGRWEVTRDRWNDVEIAVYHHPDHDYNVERMIESAKASLEYFSREFGPYQHHQLRVVEFPRYARFAQSFPNTIPFSESIGFIARLEDPKDLDYVFYVTSHEIAHQWWAHQVMGANVQGATVTSETMAQYSALMVMEHEYGRDHMRRFLRYELDAYLQGRGGELIEEVPLYLVENQGYIHYRKGSLVTYAIRDYIGEEPFNRAMHRYVLDRRFTGPPYTTSLEYLDYLETEVPAEYEPVVNDLFRTITLWDLQAREGEWERTEDGRYRVRMTVEARKYRADGQGVETEIPIADWVDVAVFGEETEESPEEGEVLALEKHRVTEAEEVIEIVVDQEPRQVGIDPFNKLIDRNPANNLVRVREVGR
jgi:ABC-type transport system involved in multi-copper enzyme maturation permease subunit